MSLRPAPLGHPVRASAGSALVAESTAAVRCDRAGQVPILLWPEGDVRPGAAIDIALTEAAGVPGMIALEPDRVRIEVVDSMGSPDSRDTTLKRFPTWGDLDDLIDVMDVRPAGPGRFESVVRTEPHRPVVEGSQMLGQAVVAAGKIAPGRRVVSAHMVFMRVASTEEPLVFLADELSSGRTMTTLRVDVAQNDRRIATGTLLLDTTASDVIRHAASPPDCVGPYDSVTLDMGVTGRDVRVVDAAYDEDPGTPAGDPVIDSWVRFRPLPPVPSLHAGLLAQYTGHMSISAALRPHPDVSHRDAHHGLSTAVNAIAMSIHSDIRADEWMLYHHLSTFAGDGMTHSECRVHHATGDLLASFSTDCMVRTMPAGTGVSRRTVL